MDLDKYVAMSFKGYTTTGMVMPISNSNQNRSDFRKKSCTCVMKTFAVFILSKDTFTIRTCSILASFFRKWLLKATFEKKLSSVSLPLHNINIVNEYENFRNFSSFELNFHVKVHFERRKTAKVFMTHGQDFFRKSVSKPTFERKLCSVSLPLLTSSISMMIKFGLALTLSKEMRKTNAESNNMFNISRWLNNITILWFIRLYFHLTLNHLLCLWLFTNNRATTDIILNIL